ncbi:hypothetical protein V8G54_019111 [Vigna mungo]|uniref:DET1- and DDB1-associated protein 1 domain-containing protein n=1 Tax=Vigna mungo TaxID=3915 RepID=A0AAQ3NA04_VIGMU
MESVLGNWPSYDPHNFSQLRPSDPSSSSETSIFMQKMAPTTYHPTHSKTLPPPDQGRFANLLLKFVLSVISTEAKNILLRHIYQHAEEKLKPKRAASDNLLPEHGCKQPREEIRALTKDFQDASVFSTQEYAHTLGRILVQRTKDSPSESDLGTNNIQSHPAN